MDKAEILTPEWKELSHDRLLELCNALTRIADTLEREYPEERPYCETPHKIEECSVCCAWKLGEKLKMDVDHEPQLLEN